METQIRIPVHVIQPTLDSLEGLIGHKGIGTVMIVWKRNNWLNSTRKPGCVQIDRASILQQDEKGFFWPNDPGVGIHQFKIVVTLTEPDEDGFYEAEWLQCPHEGVGNFTRAPGKNGKFQLKIFPK